MKNYFVYLIVVMLSGVMFFGCAGKEVKPVVVSDVEIIETIPDISAPDWVLSTVEYYEEKGDFHYRGLSEGFNDPEVSIRDAVASARIKLSEQVKIGLRGSFRRSLEGAKYEMIIGGYVSDTFYSVVENIQFSGSVHVGSYSQRILEKLRNAPKRNYWRSFVLVKIPRTEYRKAVKRAFEETKDRVKANKTAKELAERLEKKFWEKEDKKQKDSAE